MENKPPGVRNSGFSSRSQFNGSKKFAGKSFFNKIVLHPGGKHFFLSNELYFFSSQIFKTKVFFEDRLCLCCYRVALKNWILQVVMH